jgi:hypothetical protein
MHPSQGPARAVAPFVGSGASLQPDFGFRFDCADEQFSANSVDISINCPYGGGLSFSARAHSDATAKTIGAEARGTIAGGQFGGYDFGPGERAGYVAWASLWDEVTVSSLDPGVSYSSLSFWARLDGRMRSDFGQWLGASFYGVTSASRTFLDVYLYEIEGGGPRPIAVTMRYDAISLAPGVEFVNPSSYSNTLSPFVTSATLANGQFVITKKVPNVGKFQVQMSLFAQSRWLNQNAIALTYSGASDDVDFSSTGKLEAVQFFDDAGNDVSRYFLATYRDGSRLNTGKVQSPRDALLDLVGYVDDANLPMEGALLGQLRRAVSAIDNRDPAKACAALGVFATITRAQRAKQISESDFSIWKGRLSQIASDLACAVE